MMQQCQWWECNMSLLNYFFIGAGFTFIVDLLLSMERVRSHPAIGNQEWGMSQRILCMVIWPLSVLAFLIAFIKQFFK